MDAVLARRTDRAFALAVAAALLGWLAIASPVAAQDPPGNNGTVKIHDEFEAEPIRQNEPHVGCDFHVHAFGLDTDQAGDYQFVAWAPTEDAGATQTFSYNAGNDSTVDRTEFRSGMHTLPPGHWKLFFEGRDATVNLTIDAQNVKHKVFWVECEETVGGGGSSVAGSSQAGSSTAASSAAASSAAASVGGSGTLGGSGGPGGSAAAGGVVRGAVAGGQGGPGAGSLPNTAVPAELAGSLGGLLVVLSGIAYTVNRRRDS